MRSPKIHLWGAAAALLALVGIAVAGGTSNAAPTHDADAHVDPALAAYASVTGISLDAARAYLDLQPAVDDLDATAARQFPATYAGLYRVPTTGRVVLSFTAAGRAAAATLARSFREPGLVDVRIVARSRASLDATLARMSGDSDVAYAYVDVPNNTVAVVRADTLRTIAVVPDICESRVVCAPYARGGVELDNSDGFECTSGFVGTRGGSPVMITAGHCFANGSAVVMSGHPLGTVVARSFAGNNDSEAISMANTWAPENWVFWTQSDKSHAVTSIATVGAVGDAVCRVGVTTGVSTPVCGSITATNATINVTGGPQLTNQVIGSMCSRPGDSGGPVMGGNRAYGLTSTSNFVTNADGSTSCNASPITTWAQLGNTLGAIGSSIRTS